jgi:hypothetical protein
VSRRDARAIARSTARAPGLASGGIPMEIDTGSGSLNA